MKWTNSIPLVHMVIYHNDNDTFIAYADKINQEFVLFTATVYCNAYFKKSVHFFGNFVFGVKIIAS